MIQLMVDTKALWHFAIDCLNPDKYGYAVSAEVRDAARKALGFPASECPKPVVPQPESYKQNIGTAYDQVERDELERDDT